MKVLSLNQPWSQLLVIGAKKIETRSWHTLYTGRIAIHASKGFSGWMKSFCETPETRAALGWPAPPNPITQQWFDEIARRMKPLPLGAIIGSVTLLDCRRTAWFLTDPIQLEIPIPAKGASVSGNGSHRRE